MAYGTSESGRLARAVGVNRIVFALSLARAVDAIGNGLAFIVVPLYVAALPSNLLKLPVPTLVGIVLSIFGVVSVVGQLLLGPLSDRLGRRKTFVQVGLLLMVFSLVAFNFAGDFSHLLLIRVVQGLAFGLTVPASMALMAMNSEKQTRGGSMGFFGMLRTAGFATGPLLGGFLYDRFGFSSVFLTGAVIVMAAVVLIHLLVEEPRNTQKAESVPEVRKEPGALVLYTENGLLVLGLATAFMSSAFSMMGTLTNEFIVLLSVSTFAFSLAFSAMTVTSFIVQVPVGRISDLFGRKRLIVAGLLLMAPATMAMGHVTSLWQLIALRMVQGAGSAAGFTASMALAGDVVRPGFEARQMSILTIGFSLGMAVGPFLAGVIAGRSTFQMPFYAGGLLCVAGALLVWRYAVETVRAHAVSEERLPVPAIGGTGRSR